ncbi:unnamed protein product [Pleuronectes platessa]|uniref:Uncharacterized protein n=1 Tax=Pleuronectes platessa TaxID=8262 RepID=A0A9N7TY43_PLEPL|nr:unnamed protein product [Pleuronectes platessa]
MTSPAPERLHSNTLLRGCLQTSWLEAHFHPVFKTKTRRVSVILVFDCTFFQSVSSALGAEPVNPRYRQTAWEESEGSREVGEIQVDPFSSPRRLLGEEEEEGGGGGGGGGACVPKITVRPPRSLSPEASAAVLTENNAQPAKSVLL